jgi:hypothetical protein
MSAAQRHPASNSNPFLPNCCQKFIGALFITMPSTKPQKHQPKTNRKMSSQQGSGACMSGMCRNQQEIEEATKAFLRVQTRLVKIVRDFEMQLVFQTFKDELDLIIKNTAREETSVVQDHLTKFKLDVTIQYAEIEVALDDLKTHYQFLSELTGPANDMTESYESLGSSAMKVLAQREALLKMANEAVGTIGRALMAGGKKKKRVVKTNKVVPTGKVAVSAARGRNPAKV